MRTARAAAALVLLAATVSRAADDGLDDSVRRAEAAADRAEAAATRSEAAATRVEDAFARLEKVLEELERSDAARRRGERH